MQLLGKRIIMTKSAVKDTDVSLTVSRIENKEGQQEFFLDVQCKDSTPGAILCNSPKINKVRLGFKDLQGEVVSQAE